MNSFHSYKKSGDAMDRNETVLEYLINKGQIPSFAFPLDTVVLFGNKC